jgi:hypothetical protein
MKGFEYSMDKGQLVIRELPSCRVIHRKAFEAPVLQVLPLSEIGGCLVLLDPSGTKQPTFENLFKVGPDGSVEWKAELPRSHDAFVSVNEFGDHVEARTWDGDRVEIDLERGRAKNVRFVK